MVSKRWFTRIGWSDGWGRWRQRVAGLIHQTFTPPKYHGVVLVPGHVSTREIRKEYFQECPLCHSLQKSTRSIKGMKNLLLQAFPTCWQDMMDVYQKVTERPFGYTVLDLHPASDDSKRVFSHLLTHEGYPRWHRRIGKEGVWSLRKTNDILNITSIVSAHLKHVVLGEGWREPCVLHQQIFLAQWKKTMMKT